MAFDCPRIMQIIWWDNSELYGDENAQEKALNLIEKEDAVFVSGWVIRDYEMRHNCKIIYYNGNTPQLPAIYAIRYEAYAIPKCYAIEMVKEFDPGDAGCFMLRDLNYLDDDTKHRWRFHMHRVTNEHLVLDFDYSDAPRVRQPRTIQRP